MLSATSGKSLEYQALFCYNYIEQMFLFDDSEKKHLDFFITERPVYGTLGLIKYRRRQGV